MKKTLFSLFLVLSGAVLFAQPNRQIRNQNTPKSVQDAFTRAHPNAGNAQWSQRNGQWHATYNDKTNNRNVDDYYDNRGRHMYSRVEWDRKNLSSNYHKRITSRYHTTNYRVTRIERPNNPSLFELILNIGGNNRTVYTDERGNRVRYTPGR